jgi:hypothetical protein
LSGSFWPHAACTVRIAFCLFAKFTICHDQAEVALDRTFHLEIAPLQRLTIGRLLPLGMSCKPLIVTEPDLKVTELAPGVSKDQIQAATGVKLDSSAL